MKQGALVLSLILVLLGVYAAGKLVPVYLPELAEPFTEREVDVVEERVPMEDEEERSVIPPPPIPVQLPDNFQLEIFADGLDGPRLLTRDPGGALVVSLTRAGEVVALPDRDGDGRADEKVTILRELRRPHGMIFRCDFPDTSECFLYVAEENMVSEYRYDKDTMQATERRELFSLPTAGGGHFTRTLLEAPDLPAPGADGQAGGRLLVSVGSSCNVCSEGDERRAAILTSTFEGAEPEVYASGLRNAVGMTIHPVTGDIWVTENGRDRLGDDLPPDEINIVREGGNYGWPICYGSNVHDTDFDTNTYIRAPCQEPFETPSEIDLQAHSAPLGLAFIPEEGWPEEYWYDLIVAYHGSWNRTVPTGYKLMRLRLDAEGNYLGREDFISGWLADNGDVIGRPVDVYTEPGGIMYVTDDHAGVVYRITYRP